eukprot:5696195-Prymnesium_polylepis.1
MQLYSALQYTFYSALQKPPSRQNERHIWRATLSLRPPSAHCPGSDASRRRDRPLDRHRHA